MTPWNRLLDRFAGMPDEDRRRWVFVGVPVLIAVTLVIVAPWAVWPIMSGGMWLVAIGVVVFVAVRLALRSR